MKIAPVIALTILSAASLSSCTRTTPDQAVSGDYDYITPREKVELGLLYRSESPVSRKGLPELKQICENDFNATRALNDIRSKYASASETREADETSTETADSKLGVTGVRFSWLTIGGNVTPGSTTTAEFKGVTATEMSDEDAASVWKNLGESCKALVKSRVRAGHAVYVPTKIYKAASVSIVTEVRRGGGVQVGAGIPGMNPGLGVTHNKTSKRTFKGENMYYKLRSSDVP
jgi:hypothetical protein